MKICVYTCITGNYDALNEIINPEKNIDYYCFTNNESITSKTWKIVQLDDPTDNWRLARKIKTLGHPIVNDNYDVAVWTDANIIWQKPISEFIAKYYKKKTLSIFKHFSRNSVYDETIACLRLHKDSKESLLKTLAYFDQNEYPDNNGLYESTVYIKNLKDPKVLETMQIWYSIIEKYSPRDQLSFPYAIWKTKLKIDRINIVVWNNPWFRAVCHTSSHDISNCYVYYGNPDQNFNFNKYHTYKYQKSSNLYSVSAVVPSDTKEIEINPSSQVGLIFNEINIAPSPQKITFYDITTIDTLMITCTSHNIIKIFGDFKKGQKFKFTINITPTDQASLEKIIETFWINNNSIHSDNKKLLDDNNKLFSDNNQLLKENQELALKNASLEAELHQVLSSRGWRLLEKARKIIPRSKNS